VDGATARTLRQSTKMPAILVKLVRSICQLMISFLWDYLKSRMFQTRLADLHNLKRTVSDKIDAVPPAMLRGVVGNVMDASASNSMDDI
jgi:hypothetical protein